MICIVFLTNLILLQGQEWVGGKREGGHCSPAVGGARPLDYDREGKMGGPMIPSDILSSQPLLTLGL